MDPCRRHRRIVVVIVVDVVTDFNGRGRVAGTTTVRNKYGSRDDLQVNRTRLVGVYITWFRYVMWVLNNSGLYNRTDNDDMGRVVLDVFRSEIRRVRYVSLSYYNSILIAFLFIYHPTCCLLDLRLLQM